MLKYNDTSEAARQYAEAYASHYTAVNLPEAIRAYCQLIKHHAGTIQAGYARAQVQNIANQVVPARELLAAQVGLALRYLQPEEGETATVLP